MNRKTPLTMKQRYQLDKRREPPSVQLWGVPDGIPEGANGGFLMAGQNYTNEDCVAILQWMYERFGGY